MPLLTVSSLTGRFAQLFAIAACLVLALWMFAPPLHLQQRLHVPSPSWSEADSSPPSSSPEPVEYVPEPKPRVNHPIDSLIKSANLEYDRFLAKETHSLHDAARAYRARRGRQPPPLFDQWWEFAESKSAIMIEDMFDQIYHDLNPFWGKPAKEIREPASSFKPRVSIRNGEVLWYTPGEQPQSEWNKLWSKMIGTLAERLPDIDVPINNMDESRMVVEWEEIDELVQRGLREKKMVPPEYLKTAYKSLAYLDQHPPEKFDPHFNGQGPYWQKAVVGCPPDSPARKYYIETDFSNPPPLDGQYPAHSYQGYVRNWTLAKSPCDNPHLQGLHGTFIEPLSLSNTRQFWPLFGGSKLPVNNEILLPAAMYWTDDPFYSGGEDHGEAWRQKKDQMIWRGAASGGRNKKTNWTRFQRHRFLSMINATSVRSAETAPDEAAPNFVLPADNAYRLAATSPESHPGDLAEWVSTWGDGAFINLLCFPRKPPPDHRTCEYTDPYFHITDHLPMKEQYDYKYLPDIDGNSFSGRYRGFLSSTSLPIKATIYQEWHDSRLIPWKHFVPMDNTFIDIYGIMEYFLGNRAAGILGHDEEAKNIALGGKQWADKVLRHEDMQVYVYRLLLEFARLCDDDRDSMGWREETLDDQGDRRYEGYEDVT